MSLKEIQFISVNLIDPDLSQPRKSHESDALQRLAETIKASGVEQPIRVRATGDRFTIVYGERRWLASKLAGLDMVPCIVDSSEAAGPTSLRVRRVLENCAREDLRPMELADAIEEIVSKDGLSAADIAKKIGISESHVSKLRAIRQGPVEIREAVERGELSMSVAYELTLLKGSKSGGQAGLLAEAVKEKLTREGLARKLKRVGRADEPGTRTPTRITADLGGGRSVTVAGKALTLDAVVEIIEQLLARMRKAKSQGITLATFIRTLRDQAADQPRRAGPAAIVH